MLITPKDDVPVAGLAEMEKSYVDFLHALAAEQSNISLLHTDFTNRVYLNDIARENRRAKSHTARETRAKSGCDWHTPPCRRRCQRALNAPVAVVPRA